ncbi:LCP family protein [Galbitalea sp. SE-J8]|uniref:LCP family protein n=1 Tax=Galbitalea sp. SE-J8 TaxID=3054952 RepID=UPI00259CBFBB|nr:LCP family protein [Galbitalea sp. SE-J8]MDM4763903.1 LCP family protein [Galbitalea sp. SE-J8]
MTESTPTRRAARAAPVRHGRLKRQRLTRRIIQVVGIIAAVALVSTVSVAAITTWRLALNIKTIDTGDNDLPAIGKIEGGFNILVVGSDQCTKDCKGYGVRASKLNDVNILLHVSQDQTNAVAVSIPRDMVVPIPSCEREDGSGVTSAMSAMPINVALSDGGLPCVVKTVEQLTGLDVQFSGLVTFGGVIEMTNAIGGVPVCVTANVSDRRTGLDLREGVTSLKGKQALAFLRTRHAFGDGSDLSRIGAQQVYISSMIRTLQSKDTLGDLNKVYSLAQAATQNIEMSTSLASVPRLVSIALALKDIPTKNITLVQYPSTTGVGGVYEDKVAPIADQAKTMFDYIKNDEPFTPKDLSTRNSVTEDPTATAVPTNTPSETPPATSAPTKTSTPTQAPTAPETTPPTPTPTPTRALGTGTTADEQTCVIPR